MKRLGMGLVGPGFIAKHHLDAVRRLGDVDVVAIAGSSDASATVKARSLNVERAYGNFAALIADGDVDVVHNTTPNFMHFDVSMAALRAGKHVISDKPLAFDSGLARALRDAALAAGVAHVVTFNYRGNALVQQARSMVRRAELGDLTFIHGHYLQDWMADESVYSWRLDPLRGGASSALADIGSHWCDLAEHVSGLRIAAVLADLTTVVPVRFAPRQGQEAFANNLTTGGERVDVTSEDLGSVLLRFSNGTKGFFTVAQVLPGHKNDLQLELNGRAASLRWCQERQNELWLGRASQDSSVVLNDPPRLDPAAQHYAGLPAGHQAGWSDAFCNVIRDAYEWVRQGGTSAAKPEALASFEDGYRSHCIIDAILRSHAVGGEWQQVYG